MPSIGLHLVVYVTFAAAIAVATRARLAASRDALLTAALGWVGIFGLGAGAYFAGRSHPQVLIDLFSAWALALALLGVVVVRAHRCGGRPPAAARRAARARGFGVDGLLARADPTPWSQIERLRRGSRATCAS